MEFVCEGCVISNAQGSSIPQEILLEIAKSMFHQDDFDVCVPMEVLSLSGSKYVVKFIDGHSNGVTA